jgi:hypothetical protein
MGSDYRSDRDAFRLASARTTSLRAGIGLPRGRRGGRRPRRPREGVIAVDIEIVESEADKIDPELVRHVP